MARTILIDGRSGAGKTTFAGLVGEATGFHVIHLDEFYPGWGGLIEGARMVENCILQTDDPGYFRWDWGKGRPGEWVSVDPKADLVIEGVGSITTGNVRAARERYAESKEGKLSQAERLGCLTVWVEVPDGLRHQRALARDPGFVDFWEMWARQEECFEQSFERKEELKQCNMRVESAGIGFQDNAKILRSALQDCVEWVQCGVKGAAPGYKQDYS